MAKKNTLGIVFLVLAIVGLILAVVGFGTGVVAAEGESTGLFEEGWDMPGMPSRTFAILAFIVTLVGAVVVIVHAILGMIGKDIKILGLCGGAVAVIGGILVLVAGLVLASKFSDLINLASNIGSGMGIDVPKISVSAGIGIWLGLIGGLMAGVAGILNALKIGQK